MDNRNAVYSKNSRFAHNSGVFRLCKNENALGARLAGFWQMICLL